MSNARNFIQHYGVTKDIIVMQYTNDKSLSDFLNMEVTINIQHFVI
jgi:hypothetical protein